MITRKFESGYSNSQTHDNENEIAR